MKKNKRFLLSATAIMFAGAFFVLVGLKVYAQNSNTVPAQGQSAGSSEKKTPKYNQASSQFAKDAASGSDNCGTYYRFGSVTVVLGTDKPEYFSGQKVELNGTITNENDFPIVNGNLWIQTLRANPAGQDANGYNLVDQFLAKDNISLEPKEKQAIKIEYQVPKSLSQDKYFAASFFTIADSYNMAGVTMLTNVWASLTPFEVKSPLQKAVYLDRNNIVLNGEKLAFRAFAKPMKAGEDTKIEFKAVNERQTREDFTIKYQLYRWDTLKKENLLKETSEKITLNPGETKDLSYVVPQIAQGTYQLRIDAQSPTVHSMVDIRLTTDQVQQGRINFAGMDKFPLQKGQPAKFFACFHNGGEGNFNGTAEIVLKDEKGNILEQKNDSGSVTPDFAVLADDFKAKGNYDYLALTATIKGADGKIMDQVTTVYDHRTNKGPAGQAQAGNSNNYWLIILIAVLFVILAAVLVVVIRKRKKEDKNKFGIFLLIVFSSVALFALTSAKSARAFPHFPPGYPTCTVGTCDFGTYNGSSTFVLMPDATDWAYDFYVMYNSWLALQPNCLFKSGGNCLSSGATIHVGDTITAPLLWDGEWTSEAGAQDTPPFDGVWYPTMFDSSLRAYVDGAPDNSISSSNPTEVSVSGQNVTALQPGSVTLTLDTNFPVVDEQSNWYGVVTARSRLTNQANFTLNIISNCTPAWTPWSACLNHQQFQHDNAGCMADVLQACNSAPSVPTVSGPEKGNISQSYDFTASGSIDPDGDRIQYRFDWGDGSIKSDWTSLVSSGGSNYLSHPYSSAGTYQIKAQAQDEFGAQSDWSDPIDFSVDPFSTCGPSPCATLGNLCANNVPSSCTDLKPNPCATGSSCIESTVKVLNKIVKWTCRDSCGVDFSCKQKFSDPQDGKCGTANGKSICNGLGAYTLCDKGTPSPASPFLDGYDVTWQCVDSNGCGGTPASCSAQGSKSCGWNETNP